jgi:protein TonB
MVPALTQPFVQSRPPFVVSLFASVALHLAALAVLFSMALPPVEAPQAFQVEILPPQPLAPPPTPASAPSPPSPPKLEPLQRLKRLLSNAPATPATPPAERVPEPPVSAARSEPAEEARTAVKDAPPTQRKAEAPAPAVTPPSLNASYLRNPPPRYPTASRRNGEQGTVLLKVLISREGAALKVELDKSSGWPNLDAAALEAVRGWNFVPARRGNEAIEMSYIVPVVFRLESGG